MTDKTNYSDSAPFSEEALDHIDPLRERKKQLTSEEYDFHLDLLRAKLIHRIDTALGDN